MVNERVIPINKIKKGAKIILFGAGKTGKQYWKQNTLLNWCEICLVVDTDYNKVIDFPVKVEAPDEIREVTVYDGILIAVVSETQRRKAVEMLLDMGVDKRKIIEDVSCFCIRESYDDIMCFTENEESNDILKIGFCLEGSIGDDIISLKLYQTLVQMAPVSKIDIFTTFFGFPEIIFWGQKNLNHFIHRMPEKEDRDGYDILIRSYYEPSLIYCNLTRVESIYPVLAEKLKILFEYQKRELVNSSGQFYYVRRIQWDRARFMGWNCYTFLGSSGAFDIKDQYVDFYTNSEYEQRFEELKPQKPYITYNFGAANPLKDGKRHTKMWPYEYHTELNRLLKARFPQIELIQLGADDVTCIPGADRYILGENLEVTKYILKNSLFHFDCEGGLVHMATQLGTKCFVVFGPTPVGFFGYDRNVNIAPKVCGECCGLTKDWFTHCYKYEKAECMYSISPEYVFSLLEKYLQDLGY